MNAMQVSNAVRCLSTVVFLVTCITSALTEAASYQKTDGTIVDPILDTNDSPHGYSGVNLESHANLTGAELRFANLYRADLTGANLTGADLSRAYLTNAYLNEAYLTEANLRSVSSGGITGIPSACPLTGNSHKGI